MISLEFTRDYQCRFLINLVRDQKLFQDLSRDLHLDDFDLSGCRLIYEVVRTYFREHQVLPPFATIELEVTLALQGARQYETMVSDQEFDSVAVILGMLASTRPESLDPKYFRARFKEFLASTRFMSVESRNMTPSEKMAEMVQLHENLSRVGGKEITFHNALAPVAPMKGSDQVRFGTGMNEVDRLIDGGICRRQHGVMIAGTGIGKTNFFLNCHVWAALKGLQSLDIALEMELWMLQERYQAMMAHVDAGWFKDKLNPRFDPASEWRHALSMSPEFVYNRLFDIADYSTKFINLTTVHDTIRAWKDSCYQRGIDVDRNCVMVTLDYFDKLVMEGLPGISKNANDADKIKRGTEILANIGREENVAIWTASQITKAAVKREVLDVSHSAHAYHRSDATDIALGLAPMDTDSPVQRDNPISSETDDRPVTGVTCSRTLNCSIMKARGTAAAGKAATTYQGPTLRYWSSINQYNDTSHLLFGKRDVDLFYRVMQHPIRKAT